MQQQMQVLIYFGATQTGKSSTLKLLTGDESVVCGDYGKRISTTCDIRIYRELKPKMSQQFLHIDTMGFGDNRLRYTDEDIRNKIQMEILKFSQSQDILSIKAILLTESLVGDSYQFSKNILQISNIFGYFPSRSIIVLGTKSNQLRDREVLQDRQHIIRQVMIGHDIPEKNYLTFMTPFKHLNENQINIQQYTRLEAIIRKCEPVRLESIKYKKEIINSIALRIQKEETKTIQNEYQTQRVQYRTQQQAYTVTVPREQWRGTMGKIFGRHLGGKKTVYHNETHYRNIQVPYTVTEKVKKYTTVPPQYQYCYAKALQEFEQNILNGFKSE